MKLLLLVSIGGAVGTFCRYGLALLLHRVLADYPVGTLVVNLLGCLLIGLLAGLHPRMDQTWFLVLTIGFCGGFTTFSSFIMDGYILQKMPAWGPFFLYSSVSLLGGWLLCLGGIWLSQKYLA